MSQGITIIMGRVLRPEEMQQAVQDVLAQAPRSTSDFLSISLDPQQPQSPQLQIAQQRAIIWFSFDARPSAESNEPDEGHLTYYQSGYTVNDVQLRFIETQLGGPIRSLIPVSYASDEGSQRLALLLANAVGKVSPVLIDMEWPEESDPFTLEAIHALLATGDPNPIYQAWLAFKTSHQHSSPKEPS